MHLSALLDSVARSSGPEEAVIHRGQRWSYQEFADAARRAATALSDAGLRPGDRLAVMTYNTPAGQPPGHRGGPAPGRLLRGAGGGGPAVCR